MYMSLPSAAARSPYDPRYDPLVAPHPGQGRDYAPTYWVASAGAPPADDGPVQGDLDADVVIVGSGFTGLAAALFLAREHGIRATVLEANRAVWGCTSRNGGQGQNASGRLYRSQWIARWGKETALRLDTEIREGFETFRALDRLFRARDHHLAAAVVVGGFADRARQIERVLRLLRDHRHGGKIEAQNRRHRALADRHGLLHRVAANAQQLGGVLERERAGGGEGRIFA